MTHLIVPCHYRDRGSQLGTIHAQRCHFTLQWDTVDAEIKVPSVENPETTNVLTLKPGNRGCTSGGVYVPYIYTHAM